MILIGTNFRQWFGDKLFASLKELSARLAT